MILTVTGLGERRGMKNGRDLFFGAVIVGGMGLGAFGAFGAFGALVRPARLIAPATACRVEPIIAPILVYVSPSS